MLKVQLHLNAAINSDSSSVNNTPMQHIFSTGITFWHQSDQTNHLHTSGLRSSAEDCCCGGEIVSHLRGSSVTATPDTIFTKNYNCFMAPGPCLGLPGWVGTRKVKPIQIYWNKR